MSIICFRGEWNRWRNSSSLLGSLLVVLYLSGCVTSGTYLDDQSSAEFKFDQYEVDYNLDGRSDLVYRNDDHFKVHLQNERGLFDASSTTFTTGAKFDSDEIASLAIPREARYR